MNAFVCHHGLVNLADPPAAKIAETTELLDCLAGKGNTQIYFLAVKLTSVSSFHWQTTGEGFGKTGGASVGW